MRLLTVDTLRAELLVPEKEMEDVIVGSQVHMKVRGLPSENFSGRVEFIAPIAQVVDGERMFVVRSPISEKHESLKPEMTGVARIYAGKRPIISIATRRIQRWIKTDLLTLLP